jgi:ABC-type transport system substrate-binding protein
LGGILKLATNASSTVFGYPPLIAYSGYGDSSPVLEALFNFDGQGRVIPRLAKGYEVSADKKTFTISLREGVKFHDGTICDAEAVKWNFEQFAVEKVARLGVVSSMDVVDKYTLRLNLTSFSNSLLYDLALSCIISPTAYKTNGKEWTYTHPVGTGAFKLVSFERNVLLKYERFDDYWQKGKPYLAGIDMQFVADATVRAMSFKNGDVDILRNANPQDIGGLKDAGYAVRTTPGGVHSLYPDTMNPDSKFKDQRVREAVEYAIDRNAIGQLGYGYYDACTQCVYSSRFAYVPGLPVREFNVAKAKQLLADAGYPDGFDTKIIATVTDDDNVLTAIKSYLADVGIRATIEKNDFGKFMNYYYGGWKDALLFWIIPAEENSLSGLYNQLHPKSNYAISLYKPPELGTMLENADTEVDYDKMVVGCQDVVKFVHDQALFIPIYADLNAVVEQTYVKSSGINVNYLFRLFWTPEDCWLDK